MKIAFFLTMFLPSIAAANPLRICSDPTNPPFSSQDPATPGMYLELGRAIGQKLHLPVEPVWELTYFGKHAVRETLLAGKCDLEIGLPAEAGFMGGKLVFSRPFFTIGYALVTRPDAPVPTLAALHGKRVAVQLATGPQNILAEHDDITTVTVLSPEEGMHVLSEGGADVAFIWGPSAGYINHGALHDAWRVTPVAGIGLQWKVAVGFARANTGLRDQVDQALSGMGDTVAALARKYGFPVQPPVQLASGDSDTPQPKVALASSTRLVYDNGRGARLPIVRVATVDATTDDQQSNADYIAPSRTDADRNFHASTAPNAAAEGRTIFNGTCNHCHGPDAEQSVKKIDLRLLHHRYGGAMDQVFHYTVTHGRESKGMPNWSGVFTEDDFTKILAFLHTVQTQQ
jgi:ABC-type amino acid transport substrate-binding protein/mono/diheme cytochrome c family protein